MIVVEVLYAMMISSNELVSSSVVVDECLGDGVSFSFFISPEKRVDVSSMSIEVEVEVLSAMATILDEDEIVSLAVSVDDLVFDLTTSSEIVSSLEAVDECLAVGGVSDGTGVSLFVFVAVVEVVDELSFFVVEDLVLLLVDFGADLFLVKKEKRFFCSGGGLVDLTIVDVD